MAERKPSIKARVLDCLEREPIGLSTHEIAARLGEPAARVKPRISELYRADLIEPASLRRRSGSGFRWRENLWFPSNLERTSADD